MAKTRGNIAQTATTWKKGMLGKMAGRHLTCPKNVWYPRTRPKHVEIAPEQQKYGKHACRHKRSGIA
jgi:hypothetical protein